MKRFQSNLSPVKGFKETGAEKSRRLGFIPRVYSDPSHSASLSDTQRSYSIETDEEAKKTQARKELGHRESEGSIK